MEYKVVGFRSFTPRPLGGGLGTINFPIQVIMTRNSDVRSERIDQTFDLSFCYATSEGRNEWWSRPSIDIHTDDVEILKCATKFFTQFHDWCVSLPNYQAHTPMLFWQFCAIKKVPHVFYDSTTSRLYTNGFIRGWHWSYNGVPYGMVLALDEKQAMRKIEKSGYNPTKIAITLKEIEVNLSEFKQFRAAWLENPTL